MFKKVAGMICVCISVFYIYLATHYWDDIIMKDFELFHPQNVLEILIQYFELIPFILLGIYLKMVKSQVNISKQIYMMFIQISFMMAILFSTKAAVRINLFEYLGVNSLKDFNVNTAAIIVLWLINGILLFSISSEVSKDGKLRKRISGFRWLLVLSAISWISIYGFSFFYIFYALSIAFLGGFFLLDNFDVVEKKRQENENKDSEENKKKIDEELKRMHQSQNVT